MAKARRCLSLPLRAYFFGGISQKNSILTILAALLNDIIFLSFLPRARGRTLMTAQEGRQKYRADETLEFATTAVRRRLTHETLEQLIIYAIQAFAGLVLFGLFFVTSIGADWLCNIWPQISLMIMCKIIAWIISVLGGLCCIALVVRNTIVFIKFLIKGPPKETSGQKVAGEGRVK